MALLEYYPPTRPYLHLLYRDDDILVLDKASGLLSVPGKAPEHKDSLQLRVQRVFPSASVVHRLDMATSGIMLFALNKDAHRHLSRQFEHREVDKTYIARVWGKLEQKSGSIDAPLICDWPNRPKQMIDYERGKSALTHFELLKNDAYSSLVKLKPHTGRSHQLRVHMLSIGHVILGDKLYAHEEAKNAAKRLLLHAQFIRFSHPRHNKPVSYESLHPFAIEPQLGKSDSAK
uniref:RluA family pseudouridine synthase n=1 Tax=Ningiella ruwaisensis TaxID=2364274 RepID=UPI0010A01BD9|nr:RluA family pseudouridine synthase [Ningiella ruwaisensis]